MLAKPVGDCRVGSAVSVHGPLGDWSIFRRKRVFFGQTLGRKHGPVPFPRRKGDSPIFAAVKPIRVVMFPSPRKLGQSPVNGYDRPAEKDFARIADKIKIIRPVEESNPSGETPMGLKLLDLALTVEDTFGFSIPDEDAVELRTLGKAYEYVLSHRLHAKWQACLTNVAFYKIQRAMMLVLHVPREQVQRSSPLSAVLSSRRRRAWRTIQERTGLRLPQLRRPTWVTASAVLATVGLAIAVPMLCSLGLFNGAVLVGLLTAFVAGHGFYWLTEPLTFQFQPDCTTVGQLAAATMARNYRALLEESGKCANDAEAWEMLRSIIVRQLGVRPGDLTKETDFTQDIKAA